MILEPLDAPQVLREDVKNLRVVSCCAFAAQDHRSLHCSAAVGHALLGKEWCCNNWGVAALTRNGCELLPNPPRKVQLQSLGISEAEDTVGLIRELLSCWRWLRRCSCGLYFFPLVAESTEKKIIFEGDPKQIQVLAQGQLHQRSLGATDAHWLFLNESKWKAKEAAVVPGTNGIEWVDSTLTKMHSFFRSASAVVAVVQPLFQWSCKTRAAALSQRVELWPLPTGPTQHNQYVRKVAQE